MNSSQIKKASIAGLFSTITIGMLTLLTYKTEFGVFLIASFGSTMVLLYGYPESPFAQPKNIFFGHLLTSVVGIFFLYLIPLPLYVLIPLAVGFGVCLMIMFNLTHPPAGGNPIIVIMALYFIGKFQKSQKNVMMLSRMGLGLSNSKFNSKFEIIVIVLALLAFIGFVFRPDFANNSVAFWFKDSILDIESTAIIGFVFKIIGFFFLIGILLKTVNAFQYISGVILSKGRRKDSDFDDYEEIS